MKEVIDLMWNVAWIIVVIIIFYGIFIGGRNE
jgi:hypothetical protein